VANERINYRPSWEACYKGLFASVVYPMGGCYKGMSYVLITTCVGSIPEGDPWEVCLSLYMSYLSGFGQPVVGFFHGVLLFAFD
jgi:hypothetical protein